jgi:transposase InsO family protein
MVSTESHLKATQGKHSTQAKMADPTLMHSRLMHGGEELIRSVARTCEGAEHLAKCVLKACPTYLRANARRQAARGVVPIPDMFGWVSFDIAGPYLSTLFFAQRYLMVFRDLYTGLLWGYLLRSRAEAAHTISRFLADSATHGKVVRFHSDNEFRSADIEAITLDKGIKHTFITPHEPRQNSASERMFGAIFDKVRAALAEGEVPRSLWGHAALQAIDVLNRTRIVRDGMTAWQLGYGTKARIDQLRPMYCRAWLTIPPPDLPRSAKIHDRGIMCIHLGSDGLGYRLLVIGWNAIRVSANVTFEEDVFPGLSTGPLIQGGSSAPAQGGITPNTHLRRRRRTTTHGKPDTRHKGRTQGHKGRTPGHR